jgi:hypothetical protein
MGDGLLIASIVGIGSIGMTVADQQNIFGNNPEKKWFWERPPFVAAPPAARAPIIRPTPQTGEQRIKQAQATMGEMQREIARGVEQQTQEARQVQSRQSKYIITDTSVPATKFEPYRK